MESSKSHPRDKEVEQALNKVAQLDLRRLSKKLHHENPKLWTTELLVKTEEAYRRFLALNLLYPTKTLAVNNILDEYWHCHIVDTRKYAEDCTMIFGRILHHYPYFGLPGEDDEGENVPALAITEQLWKEAFGSTLVRDTSPQRVSRISLDKVLSQANFQFSGPDAGPSGCKNGQHCTKKIIGETEIERSLPVAAVLKNEIGTGNR